MIFSLWSLEEVRTAIVFLEKNLTRGVTSVSNPDQGGVAYQSIDDGKTILAALYNRYLQLTGNKKSRLGKPRIYAIARKEEY